MISTRNALLFLIVLALSTNALAKNKFIHILDGDPIPKNKYIFTLVNIETGEIYLGYSKHSPKRITTYRFEGGIRNGGHIVLLHKALDEPSLEKLKEKVGTFGEGKFAAGGFVLDDKGKTVIHRDYSFHASGVIGKGFVLENFLLNPRLPEANSSSILHAKPAKIFLNQIAKRTGSPLRIAPTVYDYLAFQTKGEKHPASTEDRLEKSKWAPKIIRSINMRNALRHLVDQCKSKLR